MKNDTSIDTGDLIIQNILDAIYSGYSVMLHGPGGTGKSYTLRKLVKKLTDEKKIVFSTATTGIAAVNLSDNSEFLVTTLHSFAGIGTGDKKEDILLSIIKTKNNCFVRWKTCEILIIDEISMLGSELFRKLDYIAKCIRGNDKPFGGIILVMSGDFLQLPPVKDNWIFTSQTWNDLQIKPFIFETPKRYDDIEFFELLLRARIGKLTQKDIKILKIRVNTYSNYFKHLSTLSPQQQLLTVKPTIFHSKRCDVDEYNKNELTKLDGNPVPFKAEDKFELYSTRKYLKASKEAEYLKILDEQVPRIISFKPGAQVMLRKNLNIEAGLVNGSRGVIIAIKNGTILVKFIDGTIIPISAHETIIYTKKAKISRLQIPLVLAYALTIHRSQGNTLDSAIIDLGSSIFADGQAYVALSRCRNISGILISKFDPNVIRADIKAVNYSHLFSIFAKYNVVITKDSMDLYKKMILLKLMLNYSKKIIIDNDIISLFVDLLFRLFLIEYNHTPSQNTVNYSMLEL